jgi:hypothetical protein
MTDSTDNGRGPERIWALHNYVAGVTNILSGHIMLEPTEIAETTEYRRADLAPDPPAGVTVPDELYQAAKRDAEEAEAYAAEVEAKLAKAVEALDNTRLVLAEYEPHPLPVLGKVLTTLAELKGEDRG